MMALCIQLDIECSATCYAAAQLMSLGSTNVNGICKICAEICETCSAECANHNNEHCQECSVACKDCANECRKMAA